MKSSRLDLMFPIIFSACVFFTGCSKEEENYTAAFTMLNAVPDATGFTLEADETVVDSTMPFGELQANIIPAATAQLGWKLNGRTDLDSSFVTDLPNGSQFTMLFYDSASRYKVYLARDDLSRPSSKTQAYVRFFPLIVNGTQLRLTNDTNRVLMGPFNFASFGSSGAGFIPVDSISTKLRLYNNMVLLDSIPNAKLVAGRKYTMYAVGVLNANGTKKPRLIVQEH